MRRGANYQLRSIGGESLLVPLGTQVAEANGVVTLNATGRYIWELLADECSLDSVAAAVAERFDVDPQRARADAQVFLEAIARIGVLEI
jgi:hypothetical protein